MLDEVWKDIAGFEGFYQCSSYGRIRSVDHPDRRTKARILKQGISDKGYSLIGFWMNKKVNTKRVHRVIAMTFIPNPKNFKEVNHIDGNKLNNSVDNLEWTTRSENVKHAWRNNLIKNTSKRKLTKKEVMEIRELYNRRKGHKPTVAKIGEAYNFTQWQVKEVVTQDIWVEE